jgi:hypothetical protein
MTHPARVRNPFMLLINPEVVLAAIENSEMLGQLNRKMCRPLDGPAPAGSAEDGDDDASERAQAATAAVTS